MVFIRKVKTASGATAVQLAYPAYGKLIRIDHIGSAHNPTELELLIALAHAKLIARQQSLFSPAPVETTIRLKQSVSDVLYSALLGQYNALGFNRLLDEDFTNLVIARLVEPTSKLDTVRVLADLGLDLTSEDRLQRCLKRVITNNYRKRDAIEAHLTVVMAALALQRTIEHKTGITLKRFVKQLRIVRSGIVVIDNKEYPAPAVMSEEIARLLNKLKPTH